MKKTVSTFLEAKQKNEKLAILTAYDYSMAKLIDSCDVDAVLVGDSLGMVCLGYENTLSVTMADMIHHTKAVARGIKQSLLIADMPFMSYHVSLEEAVRNAGRLVQEAQAEAIKLEGGANVVDEIKAVVRAQIPVMGHLGLTPQSINMFGGFKVQGRKLEAAKQIIDDAKRIEDAGVFAIVLECLPEALATKITEAVSVPTIGIGAGVGCDGQVLVYQDMLNMSGFTPKFVKKFTDAGAVMKEGITRYVTEVKNGTFPSTEYSFKMNSEIIDKLY